METPVRRSVSLVVANVKPVAGLRATLGVVMTLDAQLEAMLAREQLPHAMHGLLATLHKPLAAHIAAAARSQTSGLVVGLCGSQGSGKSTLAEILRVLLTADGLATAVLSIDDLYLTRAEREDLATRIHPLLQTRGVPGTHDVDLGLRTLDALRKPGATQMPQFDKAQDDRAPQTTWPSVATPADVVLFEGWCVGARPQRSDELETPINELERTCDQLAVWRRFVNEALATRYATLFARIDQLVLLQAPSFDVVFAWRREQERKLRERVAGTGQSSLRVMSDEELVTFIAHYERLTRHILAEMPARADVVVELDAQRLPLDIRGLRQRP